MTCPHANMSLPTTSDPDTVCADCGEILQNPSTAALTQTEKQSTLHPPAARCSRANENKSARGYDDDNSRGSSG